MSQSLLARIYVFPFVGKQMPTVDSVANGTENVSADILHFFEHKLGNRDCVAVDMDGEVSSFFDIGKFVEDIATSSGAMVVAVMQEGYFIPHYNFVFADSFPFSDANHFMAEFYFYVLQELGSNRNDCEVTLRSIKQG